MADIDLKTATPDTSLPTTGFLFGADSQASASPSVYSTQTVATTLLGSTSLTGATVTADSPVLNLAQTWNNSGVTFTGLKFNVPTDSSAAASLLMDLQVGGSSRFSVGKTGSLKLGVSPTGTNQAGTNVIIAGSQGTGTGAGGSIIFQVAPAGSSGTAQNALATALTIGATGAAAFASTLTVGTSTNGLVFDPGLDGIRHLVSGGIKWEASGYGLYLSSALAITWSNSTSTAKSGVDTGLTRAAANIVRVTNGSTGGGSLQLTEMTAPAAPATDNVRIYAEDNGSGKTRLMALFPTGAAVQIAIEP